MSVRFPELCCFPESNVAVAFSKDEDVGWYIPRTLAQLFHRAAVMPPGSMYDSQERLITYIHADQSGFGLIERTERRSGTREVLQSLFLRAQTMTHGLN